MRPTRRGRVLAGALAVATLVGACGDDSNEAATTSSATVETTPSQRGVEDYVGMPIDEAQRLIESRGLVWVVVEVDGEERDVDAALNPKRVYLTVADGTVTKAEGTQPP